MSRPLPTESALLRGPAGNIDVLIDAPAHNNLMLLPLDRLLSRSGPAVAPTVTRQGPSSGDGSAEAAAESGGRKEQRDVPRDELRDRERGSR